MSKTLNMRLVLTNGRTSTMGVPNPKDDLAREDVEPVMQSIIDKHFNRKHGKGAYYGQK